MKALIHALAFVLTFAACSPEVETAPAPDAPDVAVKEILTRLRAQDGTVLFDAAPASYVQDMAKMKELAHKNLNQDLYDSGATLVIKTVQLLKEKKALILNYPMLKMMVPAETMAELARSYDPAVAILSTLAESDLKSHAALQRLSFESFLKDTFSTILKISAQSSGSAVTSPIPVPDPKTVELVERRGNRAIISWISAAGTKERDLFTKIEGKWIPESLDKQWQEGMTKLEMNLVQLSSGKGKADPAQQIALAAKLKEISGQIDAMIATDSKVKFNVMLGKLVKPLVTQLMAMQRGR